MHARPSLLVPSARPADRWCAAALVANGLALGGGALEFRYFGPTTPQFWAGMTATPAGLVAGVAAVGLWQRGAAARRWVRATALALLGATVVGAGLRVMGPPAMLLGLLGAAAAGSWTQVYRVSQRDDG